MSSHKYSPYYYPTWAHTNTSHAITILGHKIISSLLRPKLIYLLGKIQKAKTLLLTTFLHNTLKKLVPMAILSTKSQNILQKAQYYFGNILQKAQVLFWQLLQKAQVLF